MGIFDALPPHGRSSVVAVDVSVAGGRVGLSSGQSVNVADDLGGVIEGNFGARVLGASVSLGLGYTVF